MHKNRFIILSEGITLANSIGGAKPINPTIDCDFDNEAMTCQRCGFKAGGRDWHKNCENPTGAPPVGNELAEIIKSIGLGNGEKCQSCAGMINKMNRWGIDGCILHRQEIVDHLRVEYAGTSWGEVLTAVAKGIAQGMALKLNPLDPVGSLVDLAIRQAEAKADRPQS